MKPSALPEGMTSVTPDLLALREDFAAARGKPFAVFSVGELTAEVKKLIGKHQMLRAEDIAVAAHFMLTQPCRTAVSLIRIETRLEHP